MRRHQRWPTRKERGRLRDQIAAAGSVGAWIRSGKPKHTTERTRKARLNALAEKCGLEPPYPDIDTKPRDDA